MATGQILTFADPKTLPELAIKTEALGELDFQTDQVVWSSRHGKVSQTLLREFGRNIDGTLTPQQVLAKKSELRILCGAHGQATMTRGRLDCTERIATVERELATGRWATD